MMIITLNLPYSNVFVDINISLWPESSKKTIFYIKVNFFLYRSIVTDFFCHFKSFTNLQYMPDILFCMSDN